MELSPAHTLATVSEFKLDSMNCCFDFGEDDSLPQPSPTKFGVITMGFQGMGAR